MTDVLLRDLEDGVAVLTLNRPERLNAWTDELGRAYFDALEDCAADPQVRAIVVTGAGKGFCAGADMGTLQDLSGGTLDAEDRPQDPRSHLLPLSIPKPVIGAINGAAAGLGFVHALMCDVRLAAAGAKLTTAFVRRGLIAEYGSAWLLPRLVGHAHALDLLLSGRVVLAEEAAAMGLVNRVCDPATLLDEAKGYARELARSCSPASMAVMKRQVYGALECGVEAAYEDATRLMLESFGRPDFAEGVSSYVERRPPAFEGIGAAPAGTT